MSIELLYLLGSVAIMVVLIGVQAASTIKVNGLSWGLGPRDEPAQQDTFSARAKRTLNNHVEGLVLFGFAVLIVEAAGANSSLSALGSALYFWARLVYAPVYLVGIPVLRTLVWAAGFIGTLIVIYACGLAAF